MIEFLHPERLLLTAVVVIYFAAAVWQVRRRLRLRQKLFPGPESLGSGSRQPESKPGLWREFLDPLLFAGAGICLVLALAEPVHYWEKRVLKRKGVAIAALIDVSKSMLAEDVGRPARNRIDRARRFVLDLLDRLEGEAIGVGIFAGEGLELVPLTRDYGYCRYLVENLDEMAVSAPGSSLAARLASGRELLAAGRKEKADQPAKAGGVIILLSDGEDLGNMSDRGRVLELAASLRKQGDLIFTLGIGRKEPSLIPIRTPDGREIIDYYRDPENNFLTTSRKDRLMQQIAAAGGGRFSLLGDQPHAARLLQEIFSRVSSTRSALAVEKQPVSLACWFLTAAFLALAATLAGREISA